MTRADIMSVFPADLIRNRLDRVIDQALEDRRIVGAMVLLAHQGQPLYARAAGLADREAGRAMQTDAIFRLASVTKPAVALAAMALVEDEVIALDEPVTRWLPDFRPRLVDGSQPDITLHQLMTHSAGLSYRFLEGEGSIFHDLDISDGLDQPGLTVAENLRRLSDAPLSYAPGAGWRYSLAMDVMGAVLEQAAGKSLDDIVRERVTGPLGMVDTDFRVTDLARLVTPYASAEPEPSLIRDGDRVPLYDGFVRFAPSRILHPDSYPSGGAGMAGTAGDVLRMLEAIRTRTALKPGTMDAMLAAQIGPEAQTRGPGWGFGYGWAVLCDPLAAGSPQGRGTLQWGGVYGHSWFVDTLNGISLVLLTNTAMEGMNGALPLAIRDAVYGGPSCG